MTQARSEHIIRTWIRVLIMDQINQAQARQIWLEAQEKVKDRVVAPTLYRALELGVGVALDGDTFVLGFSSADLPMASLLRSSQHRAVIQQCISEVVGRSVRLLIIEGTTLEDYVHYKERMAARTATQTTVSARKEEERRIIQAWEEVGERITRGYARLQFRQFPQSRAMFVKWAFGVLNKAVDSMGYDEKSDEVQKRSLARVFERFATVVEVPSTMLAYEFFKLREEGKLS